MPKLLAYVTRHWREVGLAVLLLALLASVQRCRWADAGAATAYDFLAAAELEAQGWQRAHAALKEVELPHLQEQLAASRRSGAKRGVAARVATSPTVVRLPSTTCPAAPLVTVVDVPLASRDDIASSTLDSNQLGGPLLAVSSDVELAVDLVGREVVWTGHVETTLMNEAWTDPLVVEQPIDPTRSELALGPTLTNALRAYEDRPKRVALLPRPVRHWRIGWAAGVDPVRSVVDGAPAGAVVLGVQF